MEICFATNNQGKLSEMCALLKGHTVFGLSEIGCFDELPETHETLEANSLEKAQYIYNRYNISCFADDTGLEVTALRGAPGVYSARYAGEECNAENNMVLLLQNLRNATDRSAKFRTVITLILPSGISQFEGTVNGHISLCQQGQSGFGYDPVFIPNGYDTTFAGLSFADKNKISHRAIATSKLALYLQEIKP